MIPVQSTEMAGTVIDTDSETKLPVDVRPCIGADEYRLLYLPTMLSVYTARHVEIPRSDEWLRDHVFGTPGDAGCEGCREETEFLVAHQKKFLAGYEVRVATRVRRPR